MDDNGSDTQGVTTTQEISLIRVTFAGPRSAEARLEVTGCTPFQLWGAARMIEKFADDQWQAMQMQQIAQQITPVRGMPKALDHLKGARR